MAPKKVGILHPGEMGISIAASAKNSKQDVYWCSSNRRPATHQRAAKYDLKAVDSLTEICQICDILISVCPPHAALDQAEQVIQAGFRGIYSDLNAISPNSVQVISDKMIKAGIQFVDGGIIGLPAWKKNATWLHLSGKAAQQVAACFDKGPLETNVLGDDIGKASALKMCFAANSKGVSALITAILGAAESYQVREELEQQWDKFNPNFTEDTQTRIKRSARKAWRFTGEMREIADTLKSAGLPDEFHLGAEKIYARQTSFQDAELEPSIEELLKVILNTK